MACATRMTPPRAFAAEKAVLRAGWRLLQSPAADVDDVVAGEPTQTEVATLKRTEVQAATV